MTGKTHENLGLVTGLGYYLSVAEPQYALPTFITVMIMSAISALAPDLDQPGARIWRVLPLGKPVGKIVDPFLSHRSISHSFLGVAIYGVLAFFIAKIINTQINIDIMVVLVASILSYSSHLLADMFTVQGIPLLYPWKRFFGIPPRPLHGIRIITGKWFENLIIFPAVTILLVVIIFTNWQKILTLVLK